MRTLFVLGLLAAAAAAVAVGALARTAAAGADAADGGAANIEAVVKAALSNADRAAQRESGRVSLRERRAARRAARREHIKARKAAAVERRVAPDTAAMLARRDEDDAAAAAYGGGGGDGGDGGDGGSCPAGQQLFEETIRAPVCSRLVEETQRLDAEAPVGSTGRLGAAVATGQGGLLAVGAEPDADFDQVGRVQVYRRRTDGSGQYELLQVLSIGDDDQLRLDLFDNERQNVQFGLSVAFTTNDDGTWLGVGIAAHDDYNSVPQGAVAFYLLDDATNKFELEQVLPDPAVLDDEPDANLFGASLALDGTLGLVGAPQTLLFGPVYYGYPSTLSDAGAVHLLRYDDGVASWRIGLALTASQVEEDLLNVDADVEYYSFGAALALSAASGRALVGAPGADAVLSDDEDGGAVFVLQLDAGTDSGLKAVQRVGAATPVSGGVFGLRVALVGNTAAVGMNADEAFESVVGTVDVLQFDAGTGLFAHAETLVHPDPIVDDFVSDFDEFGIAVAIAPDELSIVVGAEGYESDASFAFGRAYLFTRDAADASFGAAVAHFAPSAANADDVSDLGTAVAIGADGSDVVIGADSSASEVGGAYVFPLP